MSEAQKLQEIGRLLMEQQKKAEEMSVIVQKLAELAGVAKEKSSRKKRTLSPENMRAACGIL